MINNDYKYIDHEYIYTDEKSGILRNKQNITDYKELVAFESLCVANRSEQLQKSPIHIEYANDLLKIHKYLFQDVYTWAGRVRLVEISKSGKQFLPMHSFPQAFSYIDKLIIQYNAIAPQEKKLISEKLA